MKKIVLFHFAILIFTLNAFSQNADSLQQSPTCFMIARSSPRAKAKNVSSIYCIGDKLKVKIWGNQLIKGTMDKITRDSMITLDGTEITFHDIRSITKLKINTGTAIAGGIVLAGGAAILISPGGGSTELDEIPAQIFVGAALVAFGIILLTIHPKFKVELGDHMVFKD